ncbi:RecQ family ATP-dependent DNA helicase [Georgenia halophila]|uniref:ATP-dependent DNA helicase RecQ n=1 Tax=Georgenia halophila TaxID=620889 RepID=A0ABP8LL89_9MICO
MSAARLRDVARDAFGWAKLRPGQEEAMLAASEGRDVLAVMPTGYGKSAIYQVPAVVRGGPTVVVSPLISLQTDQVTGLKAADAPEAVAVNSAHDTAENTQAWRSIEQEGAEFLFLSPEQLAKDEVVEKVRQLRPSLFVVDEAHCISSWGHDFRPDYLMLGSVRERLGGPVAVALTAIAATPVQTEIVERLGMRDPLVVSRGFDRPNLELSVVRHRDAEAKWRAVIGGVRELRGPGLVYVSTRKDTERYADELTAGGRAVAAYHAGLPARFREEVHHAFLDGDLDVVVATSAFGMGIDKPDVRFVVHVDAPGSLDSYYQEIGRAGRDGDPAAVVLHYRPQDLGLRRFFASGSVDEDAVRAVLTAVRRARAPIRIRALRERTGLAARKVTGTVNLLQEAGAVRRTSKGVVAEGTAQPRRVVADVVELSESRERIERSRVDMMRGYAEARGCRRQFLLGYLGEPHPGSCGACDICLGDGDPDLGPTATPATPAAADTAASGSAPTATSPPAVVPPAGPGTAAREPASATSSGSAAENADSNEGTDGTDRSDGTDRYGQRVEDPFPLQAAVTHREWGDGVVMSHEGRDRITIFFDREGYKTLSRRLIADQGLLRRTGSGTS